MGLKSVPLKNVAIKRKWQKRVKNLQTYLQNKQACKINLKKPWCISFKQDWECLDAYPLKQVKISEFVDYYW